MVGWARWWAFIMYTYTDLFTETKMKQAQYMALKAVIKFLRSKLKAKSEGYPQAGEIVKELERKLSEYNRFWRTQNLRLSEYDKKIMQNIKALWIKRSKSDRMRNISAYFPQNIEHWCYCVRYLSQFYHLYLWLIYLNDTSSLTQIYVRDNTDFLD